MNPADGYTTEQLLNAAEKYIDTQHAQDAIGGDVAGVQPVPSGHAIDVTSPVCQQDTRTMRLEFAKRLARELSTGDLIDILNERAKDPAWTATPAD
jgi:hypothetical protein